MNPNNDSNDPETQRKAHRALIILYVVMFVFILAPFVVYFLKKK